MREAASPGGKPFSFLDRESPYYLLHLFSVLSVASVAVILLVVGYGVYRIYSRGVIEDAEQDATAIGRAIFEQERNVFLRREPDGTQRIAIAREDFAGLDERMRKYLHPFGIYKIKMFSGNKTIVYSTDHSIIGQVDSGNVNLDRVLRSGEVVAKLEDKAQVWDLAGEQHYDVDLVEAYLPVKAGDRIIGAYELYVDVTRARQQIARTLTLSVAVLAIVLVVVFASLFVPMRQGTLWLKRAQDELRALAATDVLTGIFNRRYLLARIQEEFSRVTRGQSRQPLRHSLGFVMVDIDHFKRVNDSYGHLTGDEILREVSARLKRNLRVYDVIGRYGGEEFLVMLPNAGFEEAKEVAERMHRAIREIPVPATGTSVSVTASLGVACSTDADDDIYAVIRRADEGLYEAKNAGRDRVGWV